MKFGKDYKEVAAKVLGCNLSSYYNWDNQNRPIIKLLQTYFPNKDELEEFLTTHKIKKQELIKNIDIDELEFLIKNKVKNFSSNERLKELIRFFSISDTQKLAISLAESLRNHGIESGSAKYLENIPSMQQFIDMLEHILVDRISELKENNDKHIFEFILRDFNEKVGFDFSEEDKPIIGHILDRYQVYNTLYNLEKEYENK